MIFNGFGPFHLPQDGGQPAGLRMARKHIAWYSKGHAGGAEFRRSINRSETADFQQKTVRAFFEQQNDQGGSLAA